MKRYSINAYYTFVLLIILIPITALSQEERKVAVFDPAGTVEKALLEIVREEISSVVVNTTGYTVLERQLINKVLEENRFQESGLVNDEQVSDIGKRMGADYVFVTTISMLGTNYYISCKMIEVATARIDKQSTGTTTDGINDIPQTTQTIVKRLFAENVRQQAANRQNDQANQPVQTTETQRDAATASRQSDDNYLIQRVVVPGKENDTYKAELNKKTNSPKTSQILIVTGGTLITVGVAATKYNLVYTAAGLVAGGVCIGMGVNLNKKESKRIDLVVTENGAGMRLTF